MTPTPPTTKRKIRIDASFLSSKAGCEEAILQGLLNGYTFPIPSNDMQFGSAFHFFAAEMYRSGGDNGKAFKGASDILKKPCTIKEGKDYMNTVYLGTTCFNWWDWHTSKDSIEVIKLPDGTPAVEQSFEFLVYEDSVCEIYLCGTIDKLGKVKNGVYCIDDYKTTSVGRERLDYLAQYELSVQMRTYRYAVAHYAKVAPSSIYAEISKSPVGARITGIFLQGKSKPAEFITSDVFIFSDADMTEYKFLLESFCIKIARVYKQTIDYAGIANYGLNREGMMTGYCGKKYGVCDFFKTCVHHHNPAVKQAILDKHFAKRDYNPLMFGKE
jgi:PD-(D/E)XK nuclease superfamily